MRQFLLMLVYKVGRWAKLGLG